jgi:hypothetical protein
MLRTAIFVIALLSMWARTAHAQQCLHGSNESPDQAARRREAVGATRTINNIQARQFVVGASRVYLRQPELAGSPFAATFRESTNESIRRISLNPSEDILPGWKLTLDVSESGYWFMIKDTTDPCGFAFISNQNGLIFTAEPIR